MVTFGKALKTLRGRRKGPEIARLALGDDSPKRERRDFANYLSRIERDKVPNVGLPQLRLIAKGLQFQSLGPFFSALDAIELRADSVVEAAEDDNGLDLADILTPHNDRDSFSASATSADRAFLTRLAAALINVVDAADPRRQDATTRRHTPQRTKNPRGHRR